MKNKPHYETIPLLKKFKRIFSSMDYKEINLWPSMAPSCYYYTHYKSMGSKIFQILRIIKFLFFIEKFKIKRPNNKILSSFLIDRVNHHDLWNSCLASFGSNITKIDAFNKGSRDFKSILDRFSFKIPSFKLLLDIRRSLKKFNLDSLFCSYLDYFYFIFQTYYHFKKIDYWVQLTENESHDKYIAYNSCRNTDEIILTQLLNERGVTTFTLQNHALSPFNKFDYESISYENINADYFFVWGENSKKFLENYLNPSRILIGGNPFYNKIKIIKKVNFKPKIGTCFIGHDQYSNSNEKLVRILKDFLKNHKDIKINLIIHVDNNREKYISKFNESNISILDVVNDKKKLEEILSNSDFLILHNTTLALESLKFQIPLFRLKDEYLADLHISDIKFKDYRELNSKFDDLKRSSIFKRIIKKLYQDYHYHFYLPKKLSIPQNYKEEILKYSKLDNLAVSPSI